MKKFQVEMLAFHEGTKFRTVEVPDDEIDLEAIFKYGQNDFQPVRDCCSVSVGDVIHWLGDKKVIVQDFGFMELTPEQYESYKAMPRQDRPWSKLARPR